MNAGGSLRIPAGGENASTVHARAARRAVRQLLAAKASGDDRLARLYARLAADAVDRHLAARRGQLP